MDHVGTDENAAIARAAGGDGASFGVLVELHQQAAFRAAWLVLRDAGAAEDVAQEAFVRAYRQLGRFRHGSPFRPWLLRIVTNLALNEVRARRRRGGLAERAGRRDVTPEPAPEDAVAAADEAAMVLDALARLPADDRTILHLRYFIDLPEREIAAAIGRPAGTVKSRLHRAAKRLRAVIEKEYPGLMERGDG